MMQWSIDFIPCADIDTSVPSSELILEVEYLEGVCN